jgi:branched-chain amino acid transport system substrate-binding protein
MKVRRTILKNRLNKTVAALATGALLLVAVPVAGFASAGAATKPVYVIGYEGPLTGPANQYGLNEVYGLQLAVNQWNANNLPFTLEVKQFDDQGSGTLSPAQAAAAVAVPNLVAVVGPAFSGATHAAQPTYEAAKMPIVTPSATAVGLATTGANNFFRMVYGDDVQGTADANFLLNVKKAKSITVIDDATFYGAGIAKVVADVAKKAKAKVVTTTLPQSTSCSAQASVAQFAAAATKIKNAKPDAVFYGGYACDYANLLPALSKAGYKGIVMSADGSYDAALMTQVNPVSAAKGAWLSAANCGSTGNLTGATAAAYEALSGIAPESALYDAQAYDAGNIIVAALKSIGVTALGTNTITQTRSAISAYLHANKFDGVTGKIAFQANGNLVGTGKGNIAIYQITGKDLPTKKTCY